MKDIFIERKEYNNTITVKIVVPTGCNAKCPFCYNNDKDMSCNKKTFLSNFIPSLVDILDRIGDKNPVTVDITGGEPTLDVPLIKEILHQLKDNAIPARVKYITMTTNGCHLAEIVDDCVGVIKYINISVHDYDEARREEILGKNAMFTTYQYSRMVSALKEVGIKCSASAVIYKEIPHFEYWRDFFIAWAKIVGFISLRFRYCCENKLNYNLPFDQYMLATKADKEFQTINYEKTPDSHWCRLRRTDGFRVFFLHGVIDTSLYTKGIEYVIDNNGHCYCDYYKRTPIEKYNYEIGKIYDRVA